MTAADAIASLDETDGLDIEAIWAQLNAAARTDDERFTLLSNFGRWRYLALHGERQQQRAARERQAETKEVHLTTRISAADFARKTRNARGFLQAATVRVSVPYGSAGEHAAARALVERFVASVADLADGQVPIQDGHGELVAVVWKVQPSAS